MPSNLKGSRGGTDVRLLLAVIWIVYLLCYGEFPLQLSQAIFHLFVEVLAPAPVFWLILIVTPFACVLPGFFIRQAFKWAPTLPLLYHPPPLMLGALVPYLDTICHSLAFSLTSFYVC